MLVESIQRRDLGVVLRAMLRILIFVVVGRRFVIRPKAAAISCLIEVGRCYLGQSFLALL
jgi:hypothetical protein